MRAIPWGITVVVAALFIGSGARAVGSLAPKQGVRKVVSEPVKVLDATRSAVAPAPAKAPATPVKAPAPPTKAPDVKTPAVEVKTPIAATKVSSASATTQSGQAKAPSVQVTTPVAETAVSSATVAPQSPGVATAPAVKVTVATKQAASPATAPFRAPSHHPATAPAPAPTRSVTRAQPARATPPSAPAPSPAGATSAPTHSSATAAVRVATSYHATSKAARAVTRRATHRAAIAFVSTRRHGRALVFHFRVPRTQLVRITIFEVSPQCRRIVTIRRRAHKGVNAVRLARITAGVHLRAGTYRITVRRAGHVVLRRRFVAARTRPGHAAFLAALHRDACAAEAAVRAQLAGIQLDAQLPPPPPRSGVAGSHVVLPPRHKESAGVGIAGQLVPGSAWLARALLATAAFGLGLLTLAFFSRRPIARAGSGTIVARHREALSVVGITITAAAVLALLLR